MKFLLHDLTSFASERPRRVVAPIRVTGCCSAKLRTITLVLPEVLPKSKAWQHFDPKALPERGMRSLCHLVSWWPRHAVHKRALPSLHVVNASLYWILASSVNARVRLQFVADFVRSPQTDSRGTYEPRKRNGTEERANFGVKLSAGCPPARRTARLKQSQRRGDVKPRRSLHQGRQADGRPGRLKDAFLKRRSSTILPWNNEICRSARSAKRGRGWPSLWCCLLMELHEHVHDELGVFWVEVAGGLVGEKDVSFADQGAGDGHARTERLGKQGPAWCRDARTGTRSAAAFRATRDRQSFHRKLRDARAARSRDRRRVHQR